MGSPSCDQVSRSGPWGVTRGPKMDLRGAKRPSGKAWRSRAGDRNDLRIGGFRAEGFGLSGDLGELEGQEKLNDSN